MVNMIIIVMMRMIRSLLLVMIGIISCFLYQFINELIANHMHATHTSKKPVMGRVQDFKPV